MVCRQARSDILSHAQPLTVKISALVAANLRLWEDVLLLQTFLLPPFFSTSLLPCYFWRGKRFYSGGFWCQRFLPTRAIPEALLPFPDCLYPIPPLDFWLDQPGPQFIWPLKATNCRLQCIFYWQPTASNNLYIWIYPAQKFGVSHDQLIFCHWFTYSILQQRYPVLKCLIFS